MYMVSSVLKKFALFHAVLTFDAGASGERVSNRQVRVDGGGARSGGDPALQAGQEYDRAPRGYPVGATPASIAAPAFLTREKKELAESQHANILTCPA